MPWLIIVTGRPAAGKSTLAGWLGKKLALPVLSKDLIKEVLFDELGWRDRDWSKMLGRASVALMYAWARSLLEAGQSLILDNTFHRGLSSAPLSAIQQSSGCRVLQIVCTAPPDVMFKRFEQRAESGQRHPGHVDDQCLDEFRAALTCDPVLRLDVEGEYLQVDTADLAAVDYEDILREVEAIMGRAR